MTEPERIPIIDHVVHTVTVGRVVVQVLVQTAARQYRYAVRLKDRDGRVGLFTSLAPGNDLADIEIAARQAREWLAANQPDVFAILRGVR